MIGIGVAACLWTAAPARPQDPPSVPPKVSKAKKCGKADNGFADFKVYLGKGRHRITCKKARGVVARGIMANGWQYYDLDQAGGGPGPGPTSGTATTRRSSCWPSSSNDPARVTSVVLLHGWPGDHADWRAVVPLLGGADVVVPDLLWRPEPSAQTLASYVVELIEQRATGPAVVCGYDVGSRVAQAVARAAPGAVRAFVLAPPLPGVGERVLDAGAQREYWYRAVPPPPALRGTDRRQAGRRARVPAALLGALVGTGLRARSGRTRAARRALRRARRLHRLDRLVPRRLGDGGDEPGRDAAGSGSPRPPTSCGPRTTRCSRARGATGSTRSSPTCA